MNEVAILHLEWHDTVVKSNYNVLRQTLFIVGVALIHCTFYTADEKKKWTGEVTAHKAVLVILYYLFP